MLRESVVERHRLRIILVNVEAFATKKVLQYLDKVTHRSEFLLAIDESTTIKNIKAKRTKALIKFGEAAKYKRILTGAPITKSPLDLYAQFLFLDKEIMGFDSYWSFQGRYAVVRSVKMGAHSFNQVIGYRNLEEMKCKIAHYSYRTTKEEALDLPPKIYTTRQVDLTMEQERHYQSIKKTSVALLETGEMVTAPEVMTQLLRLQQLLCGYLVTDNGEVEEIPNNRMNVLMETIEEMEGKIIIWSRFRHDIIKITEKLKQTYGSDTVVNYFGDTTMQDRQDAIEKFQNLEDNVKFFISNPQTGGMGITLHAATNVIYYSNDFNLESRKQSEDRAHRVGQHHPVLYVDLMCPNTVDVHIVKTLLNKNKLASITLGERVLEWLKT
jgi:SNF2 family DNA or RNA helicase